MKRNILWAFLLEIIIFTSMMSANITISSPYNLHDSNSINMLIFLSPQYNNDTQIIQAINRYIDAVKSDIHWNTKLIKITSEINDFKKIDEIIEAYYNNYSIKACIMVGEDIDTAKDADCDYNEAPSTAPWYTTGSESSYYLDENGDVQTGSPHQMNICISLIYPTHEQSYFKKSMQIVSVFNKFSKNRIIQYTGDILVFSGSVEVYGNRSAKEVWQSMGKYGYLYYKEDPNFFEIVKSLAGSYSIYCVSGHSNPSVTRVNEQNRRLFHTFYLTNLDTPFFIASGCYVSGWWSHYKDNNHLDSSIHRVWYGSEIFINPHIRAMALGFPDQYAGSPGDPYFNFVVDAIPNLTSGKTLAEAMIGKMYYYADDSIVYGDPTFHYTRVNN